MKRTLLFILLFLPMLAIFYGVQAQNVKDGHEYVDLGLPSGILWATCNIGAEAPNQAGNYFAWGEIEQRDVYDWENYKWGDDKFLTKYNTSGKYGVSDFKKKLDPEDDAAHMIWGGEWRMPTVADAEELKQFCTFWIENGIGYVQGPNGNILTFALTGAQIGNEITTTVYTGPYALYWLSEVRNYDNDPGLRDTDSDAQKAGVLYLRYSADRSLLAKAFAFRYEGCNIRPVCPGSPQENEREINEQNFPDENFRNYVLSTAIDRNQNKVLDDDEILCVKEIDVHYKKIASLKGIEHFKELHKLTCYQNDLTELDLSVCPRLDTLNCAANKLKALNLSNCSKLKWIRCDQNQLSELDVSACTELELLICSSNKITTLDVSACRELIDFECHYNNLTKLDVSNNKKLVKLYCNYNQLTELDLSKNTKLEKCSCNRNRITKLILSKDNVLNALNCSTNQLYGAAMDHIVDNLNYQQQEGFLCVFNADDKDLEKNIITTKQVDALNAKGWIVFQWIYSDYSIYKGSAPTDDYHPFVKEGKTWNYQEYYHNLWNDEQWTKDVSYVINGTKEIDGKTYYKMNRIIENVSEYCCALREENRKVWMYYDGGDHLLYDFGMSVGDSYNPLLSWESYCYQLTAIKPVQFHDNHLFNVLYYDIFEDPIDHDSYIASAPIVEGVGCEKGWNIMVLYAAIPSNGILQGENFLSCYEDGECIFTADDFKCLTNPNPADNMTYRPFVEEGKVWKVGVDSGNPVQVVDYYYFDGDTIINGKACKQMMCEQFVNPDYVDYDYVMRYPQLSYVGAWYEEDKKVYFYNANNKRFTLWYDFSADANDTIQILGQSYVIGSKQTGGMKGFKGVYRDVMMVWDEEQNNYNTTWLEGIGCIDGPTVGVYFGEENHTMFLMSCAVGDEVIYFNDEYEDGATPDEMNARKQRIDFTHTVKIRPKAPMKRAEEQSLYGEYNERQLGINLNPLDEAYLVRITDESGKTFYEKTVNAGSIVGLNIDISAYAKGRYIVTVENSQESFTGVFDAQTQGIEENVRVEKANNASIYNLHGQRINTLQKGLNIVNGQKVYVK